MNANEFVAGINPALTRSMAFSVLEQIGYKRTEDFGAAVKELTEKFKGMPELVGMTYKDVAVEILNNYAAEYVAERSG